MTDTRRRPRGTLRPLALTLALVVAYSAVLLVVGPSSHVEKFPVFKWQLFSQAPSEIATSYGIRLLEVNGRPSDPPTYFEESLFPQAKSPDASVLVNSWGRHLAAGRTGHADDNRALFESRFLSTASTVRYEVVERRYDVIERVTCDCYLSERVLGEHQYG